MSEVRIVEVSEEDAELRLDRWFRRHYPALSHGRLEKLLRTGQVRVDGARARASVRLAPGQQVRVPPLGDAASAAAPPRRREAAPDPEAIEALRQCIIHRDDSVIALNKPPGLAVQGGSGVRESVDAMLDGLRFGAKDRPRLVHRLDKDTSGVLLLGRTPRAAAQLAEAFRSRDAVKTYWALVVGVPKLAKGHIDLDLAKRRSAGGTERATGVRSEEGGQRAITDYAVVETAARRCAWLVLRPRTGRTHQLRVHCAEALRTPILGDGKYGGREAFIPGVEGGNRLHLHARAIDLPHPDGGRLAVTAELPPELAATWRFFNFPTDDPPDPFA